MSRMSKLTRRAFAAAAVLTAAALTTTLFPSAAQQAVKIGALMPLTGDLQVFGENCLNGVKLAIEQINAAGGILGAPAELVVADDQTAAQPAIDGAQRLVSVERVAGIIGALGSGNTIPVATTVSAPNRIP
ncbi:MAG: ABC transporter substrate-binding protein, partial [Thermostichus sp. BF3_bins_97]